MTSVRVAANLLRFYVSRDAWVIIAACAGLTLLYWSQAASVDGLYATQAELDLAADLMGSNPAFVAMAGPARALDTVGGQVAWQAMAFGAVMAGIVNMVLAGRHLRGEEESGRDEILRTTGLGRHTPITATAVLLILVNTAAGALVTTSLVAYGLEAAGSIAAGLALTLTGLVFGAVAVVAMQVSGSLRVAYGWCGVAIAVSFLLRAIGDVSGGALSWLSPIGWGQAMRPFSGERWWPAVVPVVVVALLGWLAVVLFDRRDLGSGLMSAQAGPAHASPRLTSSTALAFRLRRSTIIGWTVSMLVGGLAYGSIGDQVGDLVGDSELSRELFGGASGSDLVDGFYATSASTLAIIGSVFAVAAVLHLAKDETDGHAELLMSGPLPRWRWAADHLVVAAAGSAAVVVATGAGLAVGNALATGRVAGAGALLGAAALQLPAMLAVAALAFLLFGYTARVGVVAWALLVWCAVVAYFGDVWDLPAPVRWLSPFDHLPAYPAEGLQAWPYLAVAGVGVAAAVAGTALLRRRDMSTG